MEHMLGKINLKSVYFWLIVLVFVLFPFVIDSRPMTILLTQIFIFAILAMSYDILLGYTGIVSFGACDVFRLWRVRDIRHVKKYRFFVDRFLPVDYSRHGHRGNRQFLDRIVDAAPAEPFLCDVHFGGVGAVSCACGKMAFVDARK